MRARSGQASVELALGLLVFVTVLMFGIHFAEMGHVSLKVQEAGAYATWEATGRRVEVLETSSTAPFGATLGGPNAVDQKAKAAYQDFDGLSTHVRGTTVIQAFTKADRLDVQCQGNGLSFKPTVTAGTVYVDTGGIECFASAEVEAFRIPTHFVDQSGGLFAEQHHQPGWMHLCSIGVESAGGACQGQLGVLTNDWGLQGDAEADACNVLGGGGCDYSNIVQRMWSPVGTAARDFATRFAGAPPTDETVYNFSYRGVEDDYLNTIASEGQTTFNTGGPGPPGNVVPAATGHNCFLGMGGNGCI